MDGVLSGCCSSHNVLRPLPHYVRHFAINYKRLGRQCGCIVALIFRPRLCLVILTAHYDNLYCQMSMCTNWYCFNVIAQAMHILFVCLYTTLEAVFQQACCCIKCNSQYSIPHLCSNCYAITSLCHIFIVLPNYRWQCNNVWVSCILIRQFVK